MIPAGIKSQEAYRVHCITRSGPLTPGKASSAISWNLEFEKLVWLKKTWRMHITANYGKAANLIQSPDWAAVHSHVCSKRGLL